MLTASQSAGVAPKVNLRITQARKNTSKGSTLALKTRVDVTGNPNRGITSVTKEYSKNFKIKIEMKLNSVLRQT